VVYDLAERADTLLLFLLYPFFLYGSDHPAEKEYIQSINQSVHPTILKKSLAADPRYGFPFQTCSFSTVKTYYKGG
jgi:hypothetical protein